MPTTTSNLRLAKTNGRAWFFEDIRPNAIAVFLLQLGRQREVGVPCAKRGRRGWGWIGYRGRAHQSTPALSG
ncbi:MAG UNVERIFIED_CONTAM: hypothetical protein LVT10_27550 [Anaerolineae bacterium]